MRHGPGMFDRLIEGIIMIIVAIVVANMVIQLLAPYVPWILLGAVVLYGGYFFYNRQRHW